jgi:hypothetical protein
VSCRLDEEEHRKFIEAVKMTKGSDAIVSDVLKELIIQFISKAPVQPQERIEAARGPGSAAPEIHVNQASQVKEETPLEHRVNFEASQSQACPFYRFDSKRQLVECDKDFLIKGRRAYVITQETCDWCWNNPRCPGRIEHHIKASSGGAEKDDAEENAFEVSGPTKGDALEFLKRLLSPELRQASSQKTRSEDSVRTVSKKQVFT